MSRCGFESREDRLTLVTLTRDDKTGEVMAHRDKTVDLSSYRGLEITSVTVRTVNAEDTLEAAARVLPADDKPVDGNVFGLMMRQQMQVQAITGYTTLEGNVRKCVAPLESLNWNSRTREYIGEIYDFLNGLTMKERDDFREALAGGAKLPSSPAT